MGEYYLSLMTHLVKCFVEIEQFSITASEKRTVEFAELNLKWPIIQVINNYQDAVKIFKLGNTQFVRAGKVFILDGYVTENVKI